MKRNDIYIINIEIFTLKITKHIKTEKLKEVKTKGICGAGEDS